VDISQRSRCFALRDLDRQPVLGPSDGGEAESSGAAVMGQLLRERGAPGKRPFAERGLRRNLRDEIQGHSMGSRPSPPAPGEAISSGFDTFAAMVLPRHGLGVSLPFLRRG
jgi:hypothetical protein